MKIVNASLMLIFLMRATSYGQDVVVGKISEDSSAFGKVIINGKILVADFSNREPVRYLYKTEGDLLSLTGHPEEVAKMMLGEMKRLTDPEEFVKSNLLTIVTYCLFPERSTNLDSIFLEADEKSISFVDSKMIERHKKEIEKIRSDYAPNNSIEIYDKSWKLIQFVGLNDGSVKKYTLEGSLRPFGIAKFDGVEVAKPESFICFSQL